MCVRACHQPQYAEPLGSLSTKIMLLLIDDPRWKLEHTDNGLFFVTVLQPLSVNKDLERWLLE